ncbi:MAG: hypothetical protein FNNCIFGK_02372 [Bacteroidia bacterium]|nr:hypothetical protein [Bacteroidia bacterium]
MTVFYDFDFYAHLCFSNITKIYLSFIRKFFFYGFIDALCHGILQWISTLSHTNFYIVPLKHFYIAVAAVLYASVAVVY